METVVKSRTRCPKCNAPMYKIRIRSFRDLDNIKRGINFTVFRCASCNHHFVDKDGNPMILPFPTTTIVEGIRGQCPTCGVLFARTPLTDYVSEDGRLMHVPFFAPRCYLCGKAFAWLPKKGSKDETFRDRIKVPKRIYELWELDVLNVLQSKSKEFGNPLFKFSYSPITKEFLLASKGTDHKTMIRAFGSGKFDDYVRGIYFGERDMIYLRMHENEEWLVEMHLVLRRMGVSESISIVWGEEAANSLEKELEGL